MEKETLSLLFMGAGKLVSEFIKDRPLHVGVAVNQPQQSRTYSESSNLPTTDETVAMLEARLNQSIVDLQPDLLDGARIFGKPCDCLKKHTDEMLGAVRELQSMASKPAYMKIRAWAETHNWRADEVARHPPEFFINLVPELRELRKELGMSMTQVKKTSPAVTEITALAKKVSTGEMTRDQAVARVKELAQESGHT